MIDLLTAAALGISSASLGLREIVLSPKNKSYPGAPVAVRVGMFLACGAFLLLAALFAGSSVVMGNYAGAASVPLCWALWAVALYHLAMLANMAAQRYPPEVRERLHRMAETVKASCPEQRPIALVFTRLFG